MASAAEFIEIFLQPDVLKDLQRVLRTNVFACRSIGSSFAKQVASMFLDMMNTYKALSGFITSAINTNGP